VRGESQTTAEREKKIVLVYENLGRKAGQNRGMVSIEGGEDAENRDRRERFSL